MYFFTFFWQPCSWYSTLRRHSKVPSNQNETVTTGFVSSKTKLQDQCISKYTKWFVSLQLDQSIHVTYLIFVVWKAKWERFNVVTPARFTNITEHLQLFLGVRLTKCHHLVNSTWDIVHQSKQSYGEIWNPKYFHLFFIVRDWLLKAYCQSMLFLFSLSSFLFCTIKYPENISVRHKDSCPQTSKSTSVHDMQRSPMQCKMLYRPLLDIWIHEQSYAMFCIFWLHDCIRSAGVISSFRRGQTLPIKHTKK